MEAFKCFPYSRFLSSMFLEPLQTANSEITMSFKTSILMIVNSNCVWISYNPYKYPKSQYSVTTFIQYVSFFPPLMTSFIRTTAGEAVLLIINKSDHGEMLPGARMIFTFLILPPLGYMIHRWFRSDQSPAIWLVSTIEQRSWNIYLWWTCPWWKHMHHMPPHAFWNCGLHALHFEGIQHHFQYINIW